MTAVVNVNHADNGTKRHMRMSALMSASKIRRGMANASGQAAAVGFRFCYLLIQGRTVVQHGIGHL